MLHPLRASARRSWLLQKNLAELGAKWGNIVVRVIVGAYVAPLVW
jgi:hypothetical protein